jgi:hypothetical protein
MHCDRESPGILEVRIRGDVEKMRVLCDEVA